MSHAPTEPPEFSPDELSTWSRGSWLVRPSRPVCGVSIDSRSIRPGNLYIALKGDRLDGHRYVASALEQGAAAAVVSAEQAERMPRGVPLLVVWETRRALLNMSRGYRSTFKVPFTAVTGSVGKTTVKEMCADILATKGVTARTMGNFNNDIGLPLSLLAMPRDSAYGVFEVGMNHEGELEPLCRLLGHTTGIVTTIGPVHIEHFKSVEAIAVEKATVFRTLPPDGTAIASVDDAYFPVLSQRAPGRIVTTSMKGMADYTARRGEAGHFLVTELQSGETVDIALPIPGEHNVHNALLAIACGRVHGIAWDAIRDAFAAYKSLYLRWQVEVRNGIQFVLDAYNANPVSMRAAARAFEETPVKGRRWLVLGGMRELGATEEDEHLRLGRELSSGPWAGLLTVGHPGDSMARGALEGGMSADRVVTCGSARDAANVLEERLKPGDAVLLKASRGEKLEEVWKEWVKLQDARDASAGRGPGAGL